MLAFTLDSKIFLYTMLPIMPTISQLIARKEREEAYVLTYRRHKQRHTKPFDSLEACVTFATGMIFYNTGTPLRIRNFHKTLWASPLESPTGIPFIEFASKIKNLV